MPPGEAMNVRGPCSGCGAQLATDQRYCVECGQRVGPPLAMPFALPPAGTGQAVAAGTTGRLWKLPIPPEMASLLAALALGLGVVIGTAISPNLADLVAAPAPTVVAEAPPPAPAPPTPATGGGGGGGSSAPATSFSPTTVASTTPTGSSGGGGGGGGGGGKKKKKKKQPSAITFSGTVVRSNPVAQSYTVATGSGLIAIHADTLPVVGSQVESVVRKLNNGTYAESGGRNAVGTADVASLRGTVTYCADLEHPDAACDGATADDHYVYAVSSLGASILVSWPHSSSTPPPAIGSQVQVAVKIGTTFTPVNPLSDDDWTSYESPCSNPGSEKDGVPAGPTTATELTQTALNFNGAAATSGTLEAVVQQTNCATHPLVLSADDVREAERDLAGFDIPAGIDQAKLKRGQAVQVAVDISAGGKLSLKGITSDQGSGGADDASQGQGTLTGS
jgi:hypothetical protein